MSNSLLMESTQNLNVNVNIDVPSTSTGNPSFAPSVASGSGAKKAKKKNAPNKTRKSENSKRKASKDVTNEEKGNKTDPFSKTEPDYSNMTIKQLRCMANRVCIYHETGMVLSDNEDIIPCQNKNKEKPKNDKPKERLEQVPGTNFGQGRVGTTCSNFGVHGCTCCKRRNDKYHQHSSDLHFSNFLQQVGEGLENQCKKREEHILQKQQQELLQHPEYLNCCENSDDGTPPAPAPELTQDKREWIQKFMDSMLADRIDYKKPKQKSIVKGIDQDLTNIQPNNEELLVNSLSAKTIVQRIDFEKERKRRSRLNQCKFNDRLKCNGVGTSTPNQPAEISTPKCLKFTNEPSDPRTLPETVSEICTPFRDTRVQATSTITSADPCFHSTLRDSQLETTPTVTNANPVACNSGITSVCNSTPITKSITNLNLPSASTNPVDSIIEGGVCGDDYNSEFLHLDRSNVTLRTPLSKSAKKSEQNLPTNAEPKVNTSQPKESDIMNFVDGLLAEEQGSMIQEAVQHCERIFRSAETNTNHLFNALEGVLIMNDNAPEDYSIEHDNSVLFVEDTTPVVIPDSPSGNSNDSVIVIDNHECPSTSAPSSTRHKRKMQEVGPSNACSGLNKKKQRTSENLVTINLTDSASNLSENTTNNSPFGNCSICLEPLGGGQEISSTYCGHVFCTACIKAALRRKKTCPNCRKLLTVKKIHPLFLFLE